MFIAQLYGIDLTMNQYPLMVIPQPLPSRLSVPGGAGGGGQVVPECKALIMLAMVLQQVGPAAVEAIGLIIGVDRLLDNDPSPPVNITGDAMVTTVIG